MEVKISIDEDIIAANTDSTVKRDNVMLKGKPVSFIHNGLYDGFIEKVMPILRDRRNIELKRTVSATGEHITWINILSNSTTSEIFALFKSMGLYMPKLCAGVVEATHTVYLSTKLCRDLSRYSEQQKGAVVMYILTLAHFINKVEELLIKSTFDGCTYALNISADETVFKECLRSFKLAETWYLKDNIDDNYESVTFCNSEVLSINDQFANGSSVKIGIVKSGSEHFGVAITQLGTTVYTFVATQKCVFTNFDLCNMEIASDSVCTFIASAFKANTNIRRVSDVPLTKAMTFTEFEGEDFDEFVKVEKIPAWLALWIATMIAKGAVCFSDDERTYLNGKYGIDIPKGSGLLSSLTREEMEEQYKDDAYAQELYKQIKPYYDTYNLGASLDANLKGFSNGTLYAMAFVGESGTGKSTAARVFPSRCGIPYISVNFSVNIEEADLFGSMIPNTKKLKPEDPEFVWADGIITKAVRNGYCVILEELNFARPGVLGKLNSLLDENRQIDLATGEIVRAHPNFRIIATCNIAYEGTNRFNKALINRFDDVTEFEDLPRAEAVNVIKSRTGYGNNAKIGKVYDVYEALKKFATEQNVNAVVSMRQLLNIFTKGKYYSSAKDAVQRIMINGAFIEDAEYKKVFEETVFGAFDLKFKL